MSIFQFFRELRTEQPRVSSQKRHNHGKSYRSLKLEPLEDRALLAVSVADFEAIRTAYPDLNLSADMSSYNVIEITAQNLTESSLRSAITAAGATTGNDLIVVRTTTTQNTVTLSGTELGININASQFGSVSIVSLGDEKLQIKSSSANGVVSVADGDVAFGGVVFWGLENTQHESVSVFDLLQSSEAATIQTSQTAQVAEHSTRTGNFTLIPDGYSPTTNLTTGGSMIGSKSFSVTVGVGGTREAFLTGLSESEMLYVLANSGSTSFISNLEPFDAEKTGSGDSNICWAGTSANMLAYSGWGDANGFQTEDDIFNYFRANFDNGGSNAHPANEWFITGDYNESSSWAQPTDPNTGGFYPDVNYEDVSGWLGVDSASSLTTALDQLKEGAAVGLGLGWYRTPYFREGGHAITLWGIVYDTSRSPTANNYYVSLLVSDSDDNYGGGVNAPNLLKNLNISWSSSYGMYRFSSYSSGNGYLEEICWLISYTEKSSEPRSDLAHGKYYADGTKPVIITSNPIGTLNDPSTVDDSAILYTTDTVYVHFAVGNYGEIDVPDAYTTTLTLSGGNLSSPIVQTYSFEAGLSPDSVLQELDINLGQLATGTYTLTLSIDTENVIAESKEWNNTLVKTFFVGDPNIVTTLDDIVDPNDRFTSLREAIEYAQPGDTVTFDTSLTNGTITLNGNELYLEKNITIDATGANITIDADQKSRVLRIASGTTVTLVGLVITNGYAIGVDSAGDGGGIYGYGCALTIVNSTISGNAASANGGGICVSQGTITITNSAITENSAIANGGGIASFGTATVVNSTIGGNTAAFDGGGIFVAGPSDLDIQLYNTIVAKNSGLNFTDYDIAAFVAISGSNNLIGNGMNSGLPHGDNGNIVGTAANPIDPMFVDSANGDYRLAVNSPAIDAGDNAYVPEWLTTDLDGKPRIIGGTVDIGAYEFGEIELPAIIVTMLGDIVDPYDNLISLREAITYATAGDTITFASTLQDQTITLNGTELLINKNINIDAAGRNITIDADQKSRVFNIENYTVELAGLTITGGNASDNGGGIYIDRGNVTITDSIISRNMSNSTGGGIYVINGSVTVVNSTISENTAYMQGGGVYCSSGTNATLTNSIICGNTSTVFGGGAFYVVFSGTVLTLTNCTVTGNTSGNSDGGIYILWATLKLYNTIVAQNKGRDIVLSTGASGGSVEGFNNLTTFTGWSNSGNNYTYNSDLPLFVDAANGDYRLAENSQAIDRGSNSYATEAGLIHDLGGKPRIVNSRVDIGAYEYQLPDTPSTIVTTLDDVVDSTDGLISLREAIAYTGTNDLGTTITFASSLFNGTILLNGSELYLNKNITIDATAANITIDADQKSRVFNVTTNTEVVMTGLTITNGYVFASAEGDENGWGGGILNKGILTVANCTITGNSALRIGGYGGGIYNVFDTLTVMDCIISGNTASYGGGGIINGGTMTVTNSAILGNTTYSYGGGIGNGGTMTMTNSTISGNTASYSGGGINNGGTMTVANCTVSGNTAYSRSEISNGGGISNGGTMTVTNSTISENTASSPYCEGGGIYNGYGTLTLTNSTITGNKSSTSGISGDGGGISNFVGTLTLTNCTISGNSSFSSFSAGAGSGGGIHSYSGDSNVVTLIDCTISGNTASYGGGGIDNLASTSTMVVINSTISDNTAADAGGGIVSSGKLTVTNSTISGNTAADGGGIYNFDTLVVINSTISGNTASSPYSPTSSGGGITCNGGILTLANSTISGNTATTFGGGIHCHDSVLTLTNSTISGNTATSYGGGIYYRQSTVNLYNTIVAKNSGDIYQYGSGSISGSNNLTTFTNWNGDSGDNFIYDPDLPLFVDAANGDYRLASGSPAINKGNNALAVDAEGNSLTTDLAGDPRIIGGIVDIGAYEYQSLPEPTSYVVTTWEDQLDADPYINGLSLREAVALVQKGGQFDTITFADNLVGQVITLTRGEIAIKSDVTIIGAGVTISGNGLSRVFNIAGTSRNVIDVTVNGLSLIGGYHKNNGGAVYTTYANTFWNNVTFSNSTALYGGAFYQNNSSAVFSEASFFDNDATYGGACYQSSGFSTFSSVVFNLNMATYGGAFYLANGEAIFTSDSRFENNSATWGGGVYILKGDLIMMEVTFTKNEAKWGGGLYLAGGNTTLTDTTFSGNTADPKYGSGIAKANKSLLKVIKNGNVIPDTALSQYLDESLL